MEIEKFFEEQKGITVNAARIACAKYTAIDLCRFAKKYLESTELLQCLIDAQIELLELAPIPVTRDQVDSHAIEGGLWDRINKAIENASK